eukprot:scaffold137834_cov31-Tisochrysis_lutea.AAC.2
MSILSISLTHAQSEVEERLRTAILLLIGVFVLAAGLYYLKSILIPLLLAISLNYTLQPVIELLSQRPLHCFGRIYFARKPQLERWPRFLQPCIESCMLCRLPHWLAVCVALVIAFAILAFLGFVVADAVRVFSSKASEYTTRVEEMTEAVLGWIDTFQRDLQSYLNDGSGPTVQSEPGSGSIGNHARIHELTQHIPITAWIISMLTALVDILSNLFIVLLFTIYLLIGSSQENDGDRFDSLGGDGSSVGLSQFDSLSTDSAPGEAGHNIASERGSARHAGNLAIQSYIKGKIGISLLVGLATGVSLAMIGVELWLVFALLGFWLNFIPTVGTIVAVALPMPIVLLDPKFTPTAVSLALLLPLTAHAIAGNVLEPMLFGKSLQLHPVVILTSLMIWAALWGVIGMVLAVPITAIIRIRLEHIDSPMTHRLADMLAGKSKLRVQARRAVSEQELTSIIEPQEQV